MMLSPLSIKARSMMFFSSRTLPGIMITRERVQCFLPEQRRLDPHSAANKRRK